MTPAARLVLGIDTASRFGSIALAEDGAARVWNLLQPGEHSSGLSRAAEKIMEERNLRWRDLGGVAVSSGPGSFTGLRIGLAWAKGVCFGSTAKLTLVSAHEANAYRARGAAGLIATVLQGERGEAQSALWSAGATLTRLWGPERVPEGDLARSLREAAGDLARSGLREAAGSATPAILIVGPDLKPEWRASLEGAGGYSFLDQEPGGGVRGGADALPPAAAAVAELGDRNLRSGHGEDLAQASPSYGRAPNARKPLP